MDLFSAKLRSALAALIFLADAADTPNAKTKWRSRELTEAISASRRYLEPSLQALVRGGILFGYRGPAGGYELTESWPSITVHQVAALLIEPSDPHWLPLKPEMQSALDALNTTWHKMLDDVTLVDLVQAMRKARK